jgi:hypothetical protein
MSHISPRIIIMQSSDDQYAPMLDAISGVNADYAQSHGYVYRAIIGNLSPIPMTGNFNRYYLLREEIVAAKYDWGVWIDADAIVMDHRVRLESIIDRSPETLIIGCRGGSMGDHDINNGVFLLNLQHPLALELVNACIQHVESLDPANSQFCDDQWIMHRWLLERINRPRHLSIVQCYKDKEYNLFNYDGAFITHVLRDVGTFDDRVSELRRLAEQARASFQQPQQTLSQTISSASKLTIRVPLAAPVSVDSVKSNRTLAEPVAPEPQSKRCQSTEMASDISSTQVIYCGDDSITFQRKHQILVAAPAAYQQLPGTAARLIESCQRYGIDLTLIGLGQPFPNTHRKISLITEYLRAHPEFRYVLQIDLKDVIFCATMREMFHKYQSFGHAIVAAGERVSFPIPSHNELSPTVETSLRYLNSGTIFSTTEAWLAASGKMQEKEKYYAGKAPEHGPRGLHIFNEDQAAWSDLYINKEADIALDTRCILFQVLNQTDWNITAANRDFLFEGRRIQNRETGAHPCVIHANADIPFEPWAQYVLTPSPVWIWPLIDRIRNAPRESLRDVGFVTLLILDLGLHDRVADVLSNDLLDFTGKGLSIWQRPNEFAEYLVWLADRPPIHSYLEIGVHSGGTFIATVEFLRRFHPLQTAISLDPILTPPIQDYVMRTQGVLYVQGTQDFDQLHWLVNQVGRFDLVFINGDHSEHSIRADWEFALQNSRYVAIHDIASESYPDVKSLWQEIQSTHRETDEFVDQNSRIHSQWGIGVVDLEFGGVTD